MKTILVATDFSDAALNAAEYATDMALCINADLVLLHTYQLPTIYDEIPAFLNVGNWAKDANEALDKLKNELLKRSDGKINITATAREDAFFKGLKKTCEQLQPYAVIMGSQGTSTLEHFFLGRHTVYAMEHLEWPLITVPAGNRFCSIKKIGLACDLENVPETIPTSEVIGLVKDFHAELHILNTGNKSEFSAEVIFQSRLLRQMVGSLNPIYHFITSADIDQGIIDFTAQQEIDLLITLPKRHGLLEKLLHKSHTRQFIIHSHVPVLVLHQ